MPGTEATLIDQDTVLEYFQSARKTGNPNARQEIPRQPIEKHGHDALEATYLVLRRELEDELIYRGRNGM